MRGVGVRFLGLPPRCVRPLHQEGLSAPASHLRIGDRISVGAGYATLRDARVRGKWLFPGAFAPMISVRRGSDVPSSTRKVLVLRLAWVREWSIPWLARPGSSVRFRPMRVPVRVQSAPLAHVRLLGTRRDRGAGAGRRWQRLDMMTESGTERGRGSLAGWGWKAVRRA